MPLMTRHLANPSDLSKMMGIRACANVSTSTELGARRQINHFAHYLPRQGVGTAYMLDPTHLE